MQVLLLGWHQAASLLGWHQAAPLLGCPQAASQLGRRLAALLTDWHLAKTQMGRRQMPMLLLGCHQGLALLVGKSALPLPRSHQAPPPYGGCLARCCCCCCYRQAAPQLEGRCLAPCQPGSCHGVGRG